MKKLKKSRAKGTEKLLHSLRPIIPKSNNQGERIHCICINEKGQDLFNFGANGLQPGCSNYDKETRGAAKTMPRSHSMKEKKKKEDGL